MVNDLIHGQLEPPVQRSGRPVPVFKSVSGYRVPHILVSIVGSLACRQRGLFAIHQVCGQADDKRDAVPCNRLLRHAYFKTEQQHVIARFVPAEAQDTLPDVVKRLGKGRDRVRFNKLQQSIFAQL